MATMVRVVLNAGHDPHWNMTLDLLLEQNRQVKNGMPFCGWWGLLRSTDLLPLIVLPDGRVDFGSDEDTDQLDRFGSINIHGRHIEYGELITYKDSSGETLFRVGPITELS